MENKYYTYKIEAYDNLSKSFKEDECSSFKSFVNLARLYKNTKSFTNIKHYIIVHEEIKVNIDETMY